MPKANRLKTEIAQAATTAVQAIADAASKATSTIAMAAEAASKVVSANAATAANVLAVRNADGTTDHDAILKLTTSFNNFTAQDAKDKLLIRDDIKQLSEGLVSRVDIIEKRIEGCYTKFEFGTFMSQNHAPMLMKTEDADKRISKLETSNIRQNVMVSIGIGLVTILTGLLISVLYRGKI